MLTLEKPTYETGARDVHIAEVSPRIEKWRIVPVGKEVKPSSLVVDLQSSSQLSADELLERFRRYRRNGLFSSSHSFRFLPVPLAYPPRLNSLSLSLFLSLPSPPPSFFLSFSLLPVRSGRLSTSRREPRRYLHVSVARETKNYYLYALVGGGGFCSSQTKLAATTPWLGLEVPVVDRSRG